LKKKNYKKKKKKQLVKFLTHFVKILILLKKKNQ